MDLINWHNLDWGLGFGSPIPVPPYIQPASQPASPLPSFFPCLQERHRIATSFTIPYSWFFFLSLRRRIYISLPTNYHKPASPFMIYIYSHCHAIILCCACLTLFSLHSFLFLLHPNPPKRERERASYPPSARWGKTR